jgi:hypothetical protein
MVIVAAILVAGAMIAAAIILAGRDKSQPSSAAPTSAPTTAAQQVAVPPGSTATCKAWRVTSAQMDKIPPLPDGADFNTPHIDELIATQNAALTKALDAFQAKIAANDPPHVVSAAQDYIAVKRTDMAKAAAHTVKEADDKAVDAELATLNGLCGL